MTINYAILGQTADASVEATLYTVPAATKVKLRVTVANRGTAATFRIALVPDGGATGNEDYIAYDKPLAANESITSATFTLNDTDVVRVQSSTANVTFTVFGIELS